MVAEASNRPATELPIGVARLGCGKLGVNTRKYVVGQVRDIRTAVSERRNLDCDRC